MNSRRRIGVLTAIAGAALALGSLVTTTAQAAVQANWTDHEGNITRCPSGTQFDGSIHTGSGDEGLFHWTVTSDKYVTITAIDPSVTGLTAYLKGGDGYRVYSPVISGQLMSSPDNNGGNVPQLSHWMLCYTITDVTTTTTIEETTTTVEETTTTVEETTTTVEETTTTVEETTTTVEETTTTVDEGTTTTVDEGTTTTSVDVGGPTTTIGQESGGPTTTAMQESGGPTTTAVSALPSTGSSSNLLLALGLAMLISGLAMSVSARVH